MCVVSILYESLNSVESCFIPIPFLHLTAPPTPPSLSHSIGCVIVSIMRSSCPLKRSGVISRVPQTVPRYKIPFSLSPLLHTMHHLLIPQRMALLTPSSARPVGHMTALTPPPRHGHKASWCINKGAKWEGGPKGRIDQMRMELAGVHFVLAAAGFLLWASGGSAASMECHFNSRGETPLWLW